MQNRALLALAASLFIPALASAADPLLTAAQALFQPIPATPPALPGNPATPARLDLGRMLFFEPRLSASHTISCNSCHNVGLGGVDGGEKSLGHRWQQGGRNSPTVLNAVFNTAQFWDGRARDLEEQAGGPMVNPVEMASPKEQVVEQLRGIPGYAAAFQAAFPDEAAPVTLANAQKAIAVFEATLVTPNAPFDRYLRGDVAALDGAAAAGLKLFIDKGCAGCHNGVNVGGGRYAPFGIVAKPGADLLPPADKGRFQVTGLAADEYVFRVPSLRNITLTAPYFHSGQVWDLKQAVAVMASSQLGLPVTDEEAGYIVAFLGALAGDQPKVVYPLLPPGVASTPRPQP
ncbi:MAG: cytochrome-c peroxidase [Gammaproteobacteria bacterium]|nr:cytochrome-c peroxidase [Gammaproteobacteria bacterium]